MATSDATAARIIAYLYTLKDRLGLTAEDFPEVGEHEAVNS